MCGIIWVRRRNNKNAVGKLKKMYHRQSHRGRQGYGYVEISKKEVHNFFRCQYEDEVFKSLKESDATEILFHHRIPTSTPNLSESNHPIPVQHESLQYDYLVVHNGGIRNADLLKDRYEKLGFVYNTTVKEFYQTSDGEFHPQGGKVQFNDSESFAIDISRAIENKTAKGIDSLGGIAFIALQIEKGSRKPVKLYYGRNDNPLKLQITDHLLSISSACDGEDVEPHKLHYLDYETGKFETERDLEIGFKNTYVPPVKTVVHDYNKKGSGVKYTNGKVPDWSVNQNKHYHHMDSQFADFPEYGFQTRTPSTGKNVKSALIQLPFRQSLEKKDIEQDINFDEDTGLLENPHDPIPGYEDTGYRVKFAMHDQTFYTLGGLENKFIDSIEEVASFTSRMKIAIQIKDKDAIEDNAFYLDIARADLDTIEKECRRFLPEYFEIPTAEEQVPII